MSALTPRNVAAFAIAVAYRIRVCFGPEAPRFLLAYYHMLRSLQEKQQPQHKELSVAWATSTVLELSRNLLLEKVGEEMSADTVARATNMAMKAVKDLEDKEFSKLVYEVVDAFDLVRLRERNRDTLDSSYADSVS